MCALPFLAVSLLDKPDIYKPMQPTKNRHHVEFSHHEILRRGTQPLNPLTHFPSKRDTLTKAFFSVDIPQHKVKKESKEKWLDINNVNPEFGIKVI
jgi:hypothetical protein